MNETQWIFTAIVSFGLGYYAGYLSHNIGRFLDKFGCLAIIITTIALIVAVMQLVNLTSIIISLIFASGFLFKLLVKR